MTKKLSMLHRVLQKADGSDDDEPKGSNSVDVDDEVEEDLESSDEEFVAGNI